MTKTTVIIRRFLRYSKVYEKYVVKLLLSSKVQAFAKGFGILGAAVGALFLIYTMLRFR